MTQYDCCLNYNTHNHALNDNDIFLTILYTNGVMKNIFIPTDIVTRELKTYTKDW